MSMAHLLTKLAPVPGERRIAPQVGDRYTWDCGCWFIYGGSTPDDWRQGYECDVHKASREGVEWMGVGTYDNLGT